MTPNEHLETIEEFVRDSERLFTSGGNTLVAAELLWGAMAHGLIAVAGNNGWRCDGHQGYAEVARRLQASTTRQRWMSDVAAGEQLHRHFYRGHLTTQEMERCRRATLQGTQEMARMLRTGE